MVGSRYRQTRGRRRLGALSASDDHAASTADTIVGSLIFHGKVGQWRSRSRFDASAATTLVASAEIYRAAFKGHDRILSPKPSAGRIQRHIGMALGGAAGGRLAHRLALPSQGTHCSDWSVGAHLFSRRQRPRLSVSTTSRGSVASATAPSSATSSVVASSISCRIVILPPLRRGWRAIPA